MDETLVFFWNEVDKIWLQKRRCIASVVSSHSRLRIVTRASLTRTDDQTAWWPDPDI